MRLNYDVKKMFRDSLAPQAGERVTFLNDVPFNEASITDDHRHRQEMTQCWHNAMIELSKTRHFTVNPIITLDLRNAAVKGFDASGRVGSENIDLGKIMDGWSDQDIIIAITGPSITGELVRRLPGQRFRFASAPNVRVDFEGFKADYSKITLRFDILTHRMALADSADMFFRYGKLTWTCRFDLRGQRFLFKENGAAHKPGEFINYPSGCANVQTYAGIAGDIRGESRTEGSIPALVKGELVVFHIQRNQITSIEGEGPEASQLRSHILDPAHPEERVITKLGLGVNDESRCNGTHVGDEKTMGMHWGYGPTKHFPDTIWAEHPISLDMDFEYDDGNREAIFRNSRYSSHLGELFR